MKTINLSILVIAITLISCKKADISDHRNTLITPIMEFTELENPYSGLLAVYPCSDNSSIYYGNYIKSKLSTVYGNYVIGNGSITMSNPAITLPIGNYNLLYWGISKTITQAYENPATMNPPLTLGADTKNLSFSLRQYTADTTYYPTFDYVFSSRETLIGTENLSVPLVRVVAAIDLQVVKESDSELDPSVDKIEILISNVAYKLNLFNATPSEFNKTIKFPLTISLNRKTAISNTVTTFPSIVKPNVAIVITLKNGKQKIYRTTLTNILTAGTHIKIAVKMGEIFSEETSGNGFTVSSWNEESETIVTGAI